MTDKKAKEILDFLARKINGYEFMIENLFYSNNAYCAPLHKYVASICSNFNILYLYKGYSFVEASALGNYSEVLKNMFDASYKGYKIHTIARNHTFLPANCTLEQILVEMDLNKSLENSL